MKILKAFRNKPAYRNSKQVIKLCCRFLLIYFLIWYSQCLPEKFLEDSTSTVLIDRKGVLLGARISDDGQWRFQAETKVPDKFKACLLEFEDRRFYQHIGISAKGIGRAMVQNISKGKVVSGGSTITMQVARILRRNPKRTIREKLIEMCIATRLEMRYSKEEILNIYASHAPFGNNVVGLSSAGWRYFGRSTEKLSWSECATLAVLPNAPGLIYPGKNHNRLLLKRNRLLKRLKDTKKIGQTEYELALLEPLPEKPLPLPQAAPHLLERSLKEGGKGKTINSTIDVELQQKVKSVIDNHLVYLSGNLIKNAAVIVTSVKDASVLVYHGNSNPLDVDNQVNVDCANSPRSTGSILKPVLYCKSMENGLINPKSYLLDVPSYYGGFSPKNFNFQYDGCVNADVALTKSLNIPFVRLLNDYGYEKFYYDLKKAGISSLTYPADHYGLSLILGGAEAKLWDINNMYLSMASQLLGKDSLNASYVVGNNKLTAELKFNRACIFNTFEAMSELNRPDEEGNWKVFSGSRKIAWKTGTSFGFRDGWAVGVTPNYVVSVWVGNADGEGRAGLTGIKAAAPLMFDVFNVLKSYDEWFKMPIGDVRKAKVCKQTGFLAGDACQETVSVYLPFTCLNTVACKYHKWVLTDKAGKYRVNANCYDPFESLKVPMMVLTPSVEKFYKLNHPEYKSLPPLMPGCTSNEQEQMLNIIYPRNNSVMFVPTELNGSKGKLVFEAAHRQAGQYLYWQLDEEFIGETHDIHQLQVSPSEGQHKLTVIDAEGNSQTVEFKINGKEDKKKL
ncbi:MAG TPA: penicillin-binding protein 1C [Bacteroidia bacterium]